MEHVEGMGEPTAGESSCPRVTSSHNLVIQKADSMLAMMLEDPFLSDLCEDCSLENVQSRLALLQGRAISIYVNKFDGQVICEYNSVVMCSGCHDTCTIALIVLQGVTVSELMQALQRKVEKQCTKEGRTKHISW